MRNALIKSCCIYKEDKWNFTFRWKSLLYISFFICDAAWQSVTMLFRYWPGGPQKSCSSPSHVRFNFSQAESHSKVTQCSPLTHCFPMQLVCFFTAAHNTSCLWLSTLKGLCSLRSESFRLRLNLGLGKCFSGIKLFTHRGWSFPKTPCWEVEIKSAAQNISGEIRLEAWAISTQGKLLRLNKSRRQHEEEGRGCPAMRPAQGSVVQTSPPGAAGAALNMLVGDVCAGPALLQMSTKPAIVFPHFQFALRCASRASCVPVCVGTSDLPSPP